MIIILILVNLADGLRADIAFYGIDGAAPRMPYLQQVLRYGSEVKCGLSLTQTPTESRPCHTAMLAGFWEDLANLLVGWKKNLVAFDHVLARAVYGFAFGGPDVVDFFPASNVLINSFNYQFYKLFHDPKELDRWTLNQYTKLLSDARLDKGLDGKIRSSGNLFFLHLAGVDTNGHRHGPHSNEYLENVKFVDGMVKSIVDTTDGFFNDTDTLYIFTADHGFNDNGFHGDESMETRTTPLVIWKSPLSFLDRTQSHDQPNCTALKVSQRDLASFMVAMLGKPFPVHNRGTIPINLLNDLLDSKEVSELAVLNAEQILCTIEAHHQIKKNADFIYRVVSKVFPTSHSKANSFYQQLYAQYATAGEYAKIIASHPENIAYLNKLLERLVTYDHLWLNGALFFHIILLLVFVGLSKHCGVEWRGVEFKPVFVSTSLSISAVGLFFWAKGRFIYTMYYIGPVMLAVLLFSTTTVSKPLPKITENPTEWTRTIKSLALSFISSIAIILGSLDRRMLAIGWISVIVMVFGLGMLTKLRQSWGCLINGIWLVLSLLAPKWIIVGKIWSYASWVPMAVQWLAFGLSAESNTSLHLHQSSWFLLSVVHKGLFLSFGLFIPFANHLIIGGSILTVVYFVSTHKLLKWRKIGLFGWAIATSAIILDSNVAAIGILSLFYVLGKVPIADDADFEPLPYFNEDAKQSIARTSQTSSTVISSLQLLTIITCLFGWRNFADYIDLESSDSQAMFVHKVSRNYLFALLAVSGLSALILFTTFFVPQYRRGFRTVQSRALVHVLTMVAFNIGGGYLLQVFPYHGRWIDIGTNVGRYAMFMLFPLGILIVTELFLGCSDRNQWEESS